MLSLVGLGILLVLTVTEATQERLFEADVSFKPNSSRLLEISFDRQDALSALSESERLGVKYKCILKQNGNDQGHFVQNGANDIVPFTMIHPHDICQPIQNLSIRCDIELVGLENVNVKSQEFDYEGNTDFLYGCDKNVFYAITIGNIHLFFKSTLPPS